MRWSVIALLGCLTAASTAPAAVIVLANFTPNEITVTVAEADSKPQRVTLAPAQVAPVTVIGPADITFPATPAATFRLDPYNAYALLPDPKTGIRLEGIELPGNPPERDARPELNPAPRLPVKVPVTLLVDDSDPRADRVWQPALRTRFDEAAAVLEAHAGIRLEFVGFATWKSDPAAGDVPALLADFEAQVKVKPGQLAIGYSSCRVPENEKEPAPFGACRGFPTTHILLREARPRAESEKVEALVHQLGLAFGAVLTPDPGSVMRATLGDGRAMHPKYRMRFDPLNVLAMNIWADELRRGPVARTADVSALNRTRLTRVYKALLKARPGDSSALTYLNEFDRGDIAKAPDPQNPVDPGGLNPKPPDPIAKKDPPASRSSRDVVARAVVQAVTARARMNLGRGGLVGDELTAAYVRAAAEAALVVDGVAGPEARVAGFLIGLGVALDDSETLRSDALTGAAAKAAETDAEREERLAVLGNPTLRGRRDLCRRFALGCATAELTAPGRAEEIAVDRALSLTAGQRPAGIGFPAIAVEFGGIAFVRGLRENPDLLRRLSVKFTPADWLPDTTGLRDALSVERFDADFGDPSDDRFQAILTDIRGRLKKLPTPAR